MKADTTSFVTARTKPRPVSRRDKALATRRRMLRAAYELFCSQGYPATTMDLIADAAGVAVQTLYFTFHTKATILEETIGAAIMGFELWDPRVHIAVQSDPRKAFQELHPWFAAVQAAETPAQALAVFVEAAAEILSRVGPLVFAMAAASASDPWFKTAGEVAEHRRLLAYQLVVELLAKRGLRRGVTVKRGTDILLAILSGETYLHLARRGWSKAACRAWYFDVLSQQLLPAKIAKLTMPRTLVSSRQRVRSIPATK
jgi:AcrR family transcriptional regulator